MAHRGEKLAFGLIRPLRFLLRREQIVFDPPPFQERPHAVHEQRNLAHVIVIITRLLIAHPGNRHDLPLIEHRHAHVADEMKMSSGIPFFLRHILVIVMNHGRALPHAISPYASLLNRIMSDLFDRAGF